MLSKAMIHHLGRGRNSVENALSQITAETLVIGIDSDILFPVSGAKILAEHIKKSLEVISSLYGHDGF